MKATDILYIEDNEDYIQFVKRAISKIDSNLVFGVVMDGNEAQQLLVNNADANQLPRLILLDVNLPDYNGIDLLDRIRNNKLTRYIPVVMFSSSENQKDIKNALDRGANAYLVKPTGLAPLTETLKSVCDFWLYRQKPVENFAA